MRWARAPGAESPALVSAPLQESAWRLTLRVAPRARGAAVPAVRCEPTLSMLAALAAPETEAGKPVAAQEASALAGGGVAGAVVQVVRLPATERSARRASYLQTPGAGNPSVPRLLRSASWAQCRRESTPGDHLRGSGLMASPRVRGEPWRSHALKAPPRRNTGALLAGCAPARPLARLYGRARSACQLQASIRADHFAALRYTTGFSPGSWRAGCALS